MTLQHPPTATIDPVEVPASIATEDFLRKPDPGPVDHQPRPTHARMNLGGPLMASRTRALPCWAVVALAGLIMCGLVPLARAAEPDPQDIVARAQSLLTSRATGQGCPGPPTPDTRLGKIQAATSWWEFHSRKDSSQLHVTNDLVTVEDGVVRGGTGGMCSQTAGFPIFFAETHNQKRWAVVDGDWVAGFVALENGPYGTGSYHFGIYHIRHVEGGVLTDYWAQLNDIGDQGAYLYGDWTAEKRVDHTTDTDDVFLLQHDLGDTTEPVPADRDTVRAAVEAYLAGFAAHDGSDVPLAPNARRTENMRLRGATADEIRTQLSAPTMNVTSVVPAPPPHPQDKTIIIEGESAVAYYFYYVEGSAQPQMAGTRFRVQNGLITEIETLCTHRPYCGDTGADPATGTPPNL